jgi:acetyltransferase
MLRHRLAALFEPASLLVVSDRVLPVAQSVPQTLADSASFVDVRADAPIVMPVQVNCVAVGARVDLALVCVAPQRLPEALDAIKAHRPRFLVLLPHVAAPFDPQEDRAYCRAWGLLNDCSVLGPRSFGVQRPHLQLNLSHMPHGALSGRVALVTQSRSLTAAILDWADDVRLGFSAVVSLGDESGLQGAEVLDFLATDPRTDSIALYIEEPSTSREFTSALRAAASVKPVVVLKVGHSMVGPQSAEDAVFSALLRRVGAVRVRYFVQLFSALKVLGYTHRPRGRRIALLSNGTGAPQLALDVMGGNAAVFRADLAAATIKELNGLLEPGAETRNPIITHVPLDPGKIQQIIGLLAADSGVDGVLVLLAPDPLCDMPAVARQLAVAAPHARKPVITCFMGDASMRPLRHLLDNVGTPAFRTPETAANAFGVLATYHYNQALSQQMLPPEPLSKPPKLAQARELLAQIRSEQRRALTIDECQQLFDFFHVPIHVVAHPVYAPGSTAEPHEAMAIRVQCDPKFGPYVRFGAGGREYPISINDRGIELPPLNGYLARELVERSAVWRRSLSRHMSPVACDVLQESLERISDLISELPDVECLVVDPLYASNMQLLAYSIRIELTAKGIEALPENSGYRHMAIHPYPRRLVQAKQFKDGQSWMMRPIRPEDAEQLQAFVRDLSDESRYMRFVSMLRELTPSMLARYTRIDYDRELALVATVQVPNPAHRGHPQERIIGFAHYLRNADGRGAEYALVIGDDWQRRSLGTQLMGGLIGVAQAQGLTYIDGYVLNTNRAMLNLMTHLGFQNDRTEDDPTMRRVWLDLGEGRAG